MNFKKPLTAALTLSLTTGILHFAQAFDIAQNGAPRAMIVVAQNALEPDKDDLAAQKISVAAHDLQEYIRKISGATLPIVGDGSTAPGGSTPVGDLILVGQNKITDAMKVDIPSGLTPARKEEGFLIQSRGDRLVLAGNNDGPYHGTEYAVYDFLNRMGVRWFSPGEWGEWTPKRTTIRINDFTVRQKPDFLYRNWWHHATPEMQQLDARWRIRNKMNPDYILAVPNDTSLRAFVADQGLAATRPELFAKTFDGQVNPYYPNLSNPETVQIAAEKAREFFRKNPAADSVGIAPDDGLPRDFTPTTMKLNQGFSELIGREGVPTEMSASEEWFTWLNAVVREVNKEFPNKIITTSAYANRNIPPFGVKIDPHLGIEFAAIWSDTLHAYDDPKSWQMIRQGQLLERWGKANDKVFIYGYEYTMLASALTPVPTTRKMARDFPLLKKWGIVGKFDEGRNIWAERGIQTKYTKAHLLWNANENVPALLDDYFSKWYGNAAKPAKEFWDVLEEQIESTPVQGHEDRVLPWVYTPQMLVKLEDSLTQAERAANTPRDKEHVQIDRLIYEHLKAYMAMNDAELHGTFAEATRQAKVMLSIRPQLFAIDPFLMKANERTPEGGVDYSTGVWGWAVTDRMEYFQKLTDLTSGVTGDLVALLPQKPAFTIDPKDEGRFAGWFKEDWNAANWKTISTDTPFYLQGYMDKTGYPYLGQMWYQFKTDMPAKFGGKRVHLRAPIVESEAWVWVNGKYIGHRPYHEAYERPNEMDVDVTDALKPGQRNVITFRVSTSSTPTAVAGGLTGRLFLYAPYETEARLAAP